MQYFWRKLNWLWLAWATGVVNEEPCFADEVVMVFVDGEIVNDGEALDWGDGFDPDPAAILGLKLLARNQVASLDPPRW